MLVELFALRNFKTLERFADTDKKESTLSTGMLILIISMIVISLIYTGGAISLSWNYNTYLGNSFGIKIFYAILVFIFPSFYYPLYALLLNPIKRLSPLRSSSVIRAVKTV